MLSPGTSRHVITTQKGSSGLKYIQKYIASQNPFRAHIYIFRKLKVDLLPIRFQRGRAMTYTS